MITKNFGIIGCGNMGGAILSGALDAGVLSRDNAYVYDTNPKMMEKAKKWGGRLASGYEELCRSCDVILLAVKPQNAASTLALCKDALDDKAIISVMAGISVERLRGMIDGKPRILRTMPNAPAIVLEGAFALCSDNDLTKEELALAISIFETMGIVEMVPENLLDAVCGLSGSGPAYIAMFIEAMADGGVKQGLTRAASYRLAAQTCLGTAKMLLETGIHPGALKDMVTSPGGTAIEGCEALEKGGLRATVIDCINAGADKSRKL